MGCDCCSMSNYGQDKYFASRTYRESFCGVLLDNERERHDEMSPHRKRLSPSVERRIKIRKLTGVTLKTK